MAADAACLLLRKPEVQCEGRGRVDETISKKVRQVGGLWNSELSVGLRRAALVAAVRSVCVRVCV